MPGINHLVTDCREVWGFWLEKRKRPGHLCFMVFTNVTESILNIIPTGMAMPVDPDLIICLAGPTH